MSVVKVVVDLFKVERAWKEKHPKSAELYYESLNINVNRSQSFWSPERCICPPYTIRGKGSRFWDIDGNEYLDMWSHMACFLGFAYPSVVKALQEQVALGAFGGSDFFELQNKYCKLLRKMMPCAEVVTFVNSGSEGNIQAMRIARARTKRENIIMIEGGFHGYAAGNLLATSSVDKIPVSAGIPTDDLAHTIVVAEGDIEAMEKSVSECNPAAVLMMIRHRSWSGMSVGQIGREYPNPATIEYLKAVREVTEENGVALVYDQVVTAFRDAVGGAEEAFGVPCDISVLGKNVNGVLGGSGGIVGKREWMEAAMNVVNGEKRRSGEYAITGGTFSTCQLSNAGGFALARVIYDAKGRLNRHANRLGEKLREGLNDIFERNKFPAQAIGAASQTGVCFTNLKPDVKTSYEFQKRDDGVAKHKYQLWMMTFANVFFPTGGFTISAVHTDEEIEKILVATEDYVRLEKG